jgi:ATP:corrinoid adenosyltransferase
MTITGITEEHNPNVTPQAPIKEAFDVHIEGIPEGVSRRNGMISVFVGAGGSGKSSLMLGMFKKGGVYHKKFHHLYMFVPSGSYHSVQDHPFKNHEKVYFEMTADGLSELHDELLERKEEFAEEMEEYKKNKSKRSKPEVETSCVIIDDLANSLKDKQILRELNRMLIKARHLNTSFIFTLQSILYMPRILRRQITWATIFRPRNSAETVVLADELLQMPKEDCKKIMDYVFDENYTHLDIDTVEGKFYKNNNPLTITNSDTI